MLVGPTLKQLVTEYDGKVRLVIKNVPYQERKYAIDAALASLAAQEQGKYWDMHDRLIERSPEFARESLIAYARDLGLDVGQFTASMDSATLRKSLDRDLKLGDRLHVYETPTFFINGKKISGSRPYKYLKKVIDEELSNAEQ